MLVPYAFYIARFFFITVILYKVQDMLLYFPMEPSTARVFVPVLEPLPHYESITINTSDGTLIHAFLLKHDKPDERPTVILYHGNAGNIGYRSVKGYNQSFYVLL